MNSLRNSQTPLLRILIVEDDPQACHLLTALLGSHPGALVVGTTDSVVQGRVRLAQPDYDLVFLDIQLGHGNGFDLVPHVRREARIIFLTGNEQHALRAFEVNALDYIVKPITARRLTDGLARAHEARSARAERLGRLVRGDRVFLRGKTTGGIFTQIEKIAIVRSSENYSEVVLTTGERTIVRRTMQAWLGILPVETFARAHRTAIVNLECIERIERGTDEATRFFVRGVGQPVPVSRREWSDLRVRLANLTPVAVQRH